MVESLLREAMDAAQLPRGRDLTPAGGAAARTPLAVEFAPGDDEARLSEADVVLIRFPASGDGGPAELEPLRDACAAVCRRARRGQTIVLTTAAYVGAARELLVAPLAEAGFEPGRDICVACSPEPIENGDSDRPPESLPRILGAAGPICAERASAAVAAMAPSVHLVSSLEAAEMAKLYGDLFRALNTMLADELGEVADGLGLSAAEILHAVAVAS
jgi:UDP-N-acetyl-D-mannosaminuronate dehydrogenase